MKTPIIIRFYVNNKFWDNYGNITIKDQFITLSKELGFINPEIMYFDDNNNKIYHKYNWDKYIELSNKYINSIYILENNKIINIMTEEVLAKIKGQDLKGFLGHDYNNPQLFEKNFKFYFPNDNNEKKIFHIYNNGSRASLVDKFSLLSPNAIKCYFSQYKTGKSIVLIGTLKYTMPHDCIGTFYVNCKALHLYYARNVNIAKQLLIDEIAYLFVDKYNIYKQCSENIIAQETEGKTFWHLIEIIIPYLNDKDREYLISFDHYDTKIDPFNYLEKIYKTIYGRINFTTIAINSINDDNTKNYKINQLFNIPEDIDGYAFYEEIEPLIYSNDLIIKNKEIDNKLDYIGRTIYNYNNFINIMAQNGNIDDYIKKEKNIIKNDIKNFFAICENVNLVDTKNIYKFLSFSVYSKYSFNEIKKIYNNIPFQYFNITKKKSKKNDYNYIKLDYLYPVIKQIFDEIYSSIIFRKDFNAIIKNTSLDGGGKGDLFEKLVIQQMTPGEHNNNCFNFFNKFVVENAYEIIKFIPKTNEDKQLDNKKVENIKIGPFLLKQRDFGGRAFDVVIVDYNGKYADFYCFQITTHKKRKDLFTYDKLLEIINLLVDYMKNFFDFEIYTVCFSYIFDYDFYGNKKVNKMCENCDFQKIKYIFFDKNTLGFYNKERKEIETKTDLNEFIVKEKTGKYFELNWKQKNTVKNILSKVYNVKNIKFSYYDSDEQTLTNMRKKQLFAITEYSINNNISDTMMLYHTNIRKEFNCVILNKDGTFQVLNQNNILSFLIQEKFDYYKIKFYSF